MENVGQKSQNIIIEITDKHAVFGCTLAGDFLPMQFTGTTQKCLPIHVYC